jgi:endonuclease III
MKSKCRKIYDILFDTYGTINCPLHHKTPFQLMAAVMLSAQCTDKQVNKVTPLLFKQYPTPRQLSSSSLPELESIVKSTGFYRNKAKNILKTSKIICEKYDGKLPEDIETLITLPGIGRKTANVIVAQAFNKPGFAVDTHVIRLLNRIGIVNTRDPVKIEFAIRKIMPLKVLDSFSLLLITHGRSCCTARKPDCQNCCINKLCKTYTKNIKGK